MNNNTQNDANKFFIKDIFISDYITKKKIIISNKSLATTLSLNKLFGPYIFIYDGKTYSS